jgi:hypothetical protein
MAFQDASLKPGEHVFVIRVQELAADCSKIKTLASKRPSEKLDPTRWNTRWCQEKVRNKEVDG